MPAIFSRIAIRKPGKRAWRQRKIKPKRKIDHELVDSPGSPNVISFMMLEAPKILRIRPIVAKIASLLLSGT